MARFNRNLPLSKVYSDSLKYYKSKKVDDKKRRMKVDIVSARITMKNNFQYNRSTKTWEQTGRSSKLVIEVRSNPKSYKTIDTIKLHKYPITFEFENIYLGLGTAFRWREGGLKKPILKNGNMNSIQKANANIKNGTQLQFFFDMEFTAKTHNLLWGVCRVNRPAKIRNPKNLIFFGKHALYCLEKIVIPLLTNNKMLRGVIKNNP